MKFFISSRPRVSERSLFAYALRHRPFQAVQIICFTREITTDFDWLSEIALNLKVKDTSFSESGKVGSILSLPINTLFSSPFIKNNLITVIMSVI